MILYSEQTFSIFRQRSKLSVGFLSFYFQTSKSRRRVIIMKDIRVLSYPIARVLGDNQQVMNSSCLRGISLIIFEHIKKLPIKVSKEKTRFL
jgi:hypothetical protein